MKRLFAILMALLPMMVQAQEKVYVSTDRRVYIAGDEIWCSLFALDGGKLSTFSAVSYLELVSADGTVATAKVGLMEGRGAGKFRIPVNTPTGNYRLIAYTALNPGGFAAGSQLVSVFNTTSISRVKDGVTLVPEGAYKAGKTAFRASDGKITISVRDNVRSGQPFTVALKNSLSGADVSVSVYALDEIKEPAVRTMASFLQDASSAASVQTSRLPEYEGEIVYAAVEGLDERQLDSLSDVAVATLSSAGSPSDIYVGKVGEKGKLVFFTNNIYGDRELVCEVPGQPGYISLMDPFLYPSVEGVAPLELSSAQYGSLVQRKAALGITLQVDTLVRFLPRRQELLLEKIPKVHYHLDDYTRFPSFQEVVVEILKEVRVRTVYGKRRLQLVTPDALSGRTTVKDNILVMLDGVLISDLSLLEGMDALLLEDVDVYDQTLAVGGLSFNGAVNFTTKKNYVKALQFPSNVRVVDFKGVSYPVAYLGDPVRGDDYRPLLYWNPSLRLAPSESQVLSLTAPAYTDTFRIVAEGLTASGEPIHEETFFEVR